MKPRAPTEKLGRFVRVVNFTDVTSFYHHKHYWDENKRQFDFLHSKILMNEDSSKLKEKHDIFDRYSISGTNSRDKMHGPQKTAGAELGKLIVDT